jgi:hypothetical protein
MKKIDISSILESTEERMCQDEEMEVFAYNQSQQTCINADAKTEVQMLQLPPTLNSSTWISPVSKDLSMQKKRSQFQLFNSCKP